MFRNSSTCFLGGPPWDPRLRILLQFHTGPESDSCVSGTPSPPAHGVSGGDWNHFSLGGDGGGCCARGNGSYGASHTFCSRRTRRTAGQRGGVRVSGHRGAHSWSPSVGSSIFWKWMPSLRIWADIQNAWRRRRIGIDSNLLLVGQVTVSGRGISFLRKLAPVAHREDLRTQKLKPLIKRGL